MLVLLITYAILCLSAAGGGFLRAQEVKPWMRPTASSPTAAVLAVAARAGARPDGRCEQPEQQPPTQPCPPRCLCEQPEP
jgi:hypothetical protein